MKSTNVLANESVHSAQQLVESMPWEDPVFYSNWLAQTYYFTRNVTRALAKAAAKCSHSENELHKMLINGILEERNHDLIALNDLKELKKDISSFEENPSTTSYYSTLMNLIEIDGPKSLLGYSVVLEGLAAVGAHQVYARAEKKFGKNATKFMNLHITVDKEHYKDAMEQISKLPIEDHKVIQRAIRNSAKLYANMILEVLERAQGAQISSLSA